ncbi:hypothetical protein BDV26DRAFT_302118 [Aspergillus bertholletiae]|uniref:Uncharacterized protein n=1 Tax=Aspergillus bertholletiae TaxID=1226010 RepID=A0A5N7AQT7_9EURO|nr:hypothetical protein BDV26DRAFT_302118 [Aspergillus bertholletiae]
MFRKLRGKGPAPSSAPATTTESEPVDPPPRAIHMSDVRQSPTELLYKASSDHQSIYIIVANAKGTVDYSDLYSLLHREKHCWDGDPTHAFDTDYLCNGYPYTVYFKPPGSSGALLTLRQHLCLVFTYDASSRESWDETVAACQGLRSRCEEAGVRPFLATMIAAMGEGEDQGEEAAVSHAEAEAFAATQPDCCFVRFSPVTGRGICDAVGSLVERAHGARDQYTMDERGYTQRYKRAQVVEALFPARNVLAQA